MFSPDSLHQVATMASFVAFRSAEPGKPVVMVFIAHPVCFQLSSARKEVAWGTPTSAAPLERDVL